MPNKNVNKNVIRGLIFGKRPEKDETNVIIKVKTNTSRPWTKIQESQKADDLNPIINMLSLIFFSFSMTNKTVKIETIGIKPKDI